MMKERHRFYDWFWSSSMRFGRKRETDKFISNIHGKPDRIYEIGVASQWHGSNLGYLKFMTLDASGANPSI